MIESLLLFAIAAIIALVIVAFILRHIEMDSALRNGIWAVVGLILLVVFLRIVGIF